MKQIAMVETARMSILADFLDTVPANDFHIEMWALRLPRPARTILFGLIETKPACGFAGCAVGWAVHSKLFPQLTWGGNGRSADYVAFEGSVGFEATDKFFGINNSSYFFHGERYITAPTPADVALRLRRFVSKIEAIRARDRRRVAAVPATNISELVKLTKVRNIEQV